MNSLVTSGREIVGAVNSTIIDPSGVHLFAGLRDDPFWIDLEQFFRIIPDRKPVSGTLSMLPDTATASSWRDPGTDFLAGLNALAIVIELPSEELTSGGNSRIGVWGTISR